MKAKLYVVAASHPCFAVKRALELKDIPYKRVEWPPTVHVPMQRLRFSQGTVPEQSAPLIKVGLEVNFQVTAFNEERFKGAIRYIGPTLRAGSRDLAR